MDGGPGRQATTREASTRYTHTHTHLLINSVLQGGGVTAVCCGVWVDGQTALHYAAERNYVGLATGLLDIGGAGLLSLRDHNQRTPLDCTRNASMKAALEEKASQLAQKEQQVRDPIRPGPRGWWSLLTVLSGVPLCRRRSSGDWGLMGLHPQGEGGAVAHGEAP